MMGMILSKKWGSSGGLPKITAEYGTKKILCKYIYVENQWFTYKSENHYRDLTLDRAFELGTGRTGSQWEWGWKKKSKKKRG
jgi:hypothetical protein